MRYRTPNRSHHRPIGETAIDLLSWRRFLFRPRLRSLAVFWPDRGFLPFYVCFSASAFYSSSVLLSHALCYRREVVSRKPATARIMKSRIAFTPDLQLIIDSCSPPPELQHALEKTWLAFLSCYSQPQQFLAHSACRKFELCAPRKLRP